MNSESLEAAGWVAREADDFTGNIAPLWIRGTAGDREIGFLVGPQHSNNRQTLHGGALMTFADIAVGHAAADALGHANCVTAQLQVYFVAFAKPGDFVSCRAEVVRQTAQLVFARGLICVGDRTVASADGIWKVLDDRNGILRRGDDSSA